MHSESTAKEAVVFPAKEGEGVQGCHSLTPADSSVPATELQGLGEKLFVLHPPGHRDSGTQIFLEPRAE